MLPKLHPYVLLRKKSKYFCQDFRSSFSKNCQQHDQRSQSTKPQALMFVILFEIVTFNFVVSLIFNVKSVIFKIWVFLAKFWHEIILHAIGIHRKSSSNFFNTLEPLWRSDLHCTYLSATSASASYQCQYLRRCLEKQGCAAMETDYLC